MSFQMMKGFGNALKTHHRKLIINKLESSSGNAPNWSGAQNRQGNLKSTSARIRNRWCGFTGLAETKKTHHGMRWKSKGLAFANLAAPESPVQKKKSNKETNSWDETIDMKNRKQFSNPRTRPRRLAGWPHFF
jgi:hypothetical protein